MVPDRKYKLPGQAGAGAGAIAVIREPSPRQSAARNSVDNNVGAPSVLGAEVEVRQGGQVSALKCETVVEPAEVTRLGPVVSAIRRQPNHLAVPREHI